MGAVRGIVNTRLPLSDGGDRVWTILIAEERIERIVPQSDTIVVDQKDLLDARLRPVLPGFIDAHMHPISLGLKELRLDLSTVTSLKELVETVRAAVRQRAGLREWLIGYDWDESRFSDERRYPSRWDLDQASAEIPIALQRTDGHLWVVNSKALSLMNPPSDDPLVYKTNGQPNGLIADQAIKYLEPFVEPTVNEKRRALRAAEVQCLVNGITTVADMYADWEVYQREVEEGTLRIRFFTAAPPFVAQALGRPLDWSLDRHRCQMRFAKLFLDGSIGARTAALRVPYRDQPSETGRLFLRDRACEGLMMDLNEKGWCLAVHAIGDLAIDQAIESFRFLRMESTCFRRHRLEHLELLHPEHIPWLKRLFIVPSLQPNFITRWQGSGGLYEERLGKDRAFKMNPIGSLLSAGLPVAFGSDGMPLGPFYGILGALTHPDPKERISLAQALWCYTQGAAFACGVEGQAGTLAPGLLADIVILSHLPNEDAFPDVWRDIRVEEVVIGGRHVLKDGQMIWDEKEP
ncbi:MAG: amidohydrolase [Armatimonadetes bacterium]|nr:amidohydrolase [Armatimonadota bacterium]MDW8121576.1 amidohydrolase family protein [Armatimonadota bacterium]